MGKAAQSDTAFTDRGWSQRRIAGELETNRETVRRCLRLAYPAIFDRPTLRRERIENQSFRLPALGCPPGFAQKGLEAIFDFNPIVD
jgi:hypothetical protein